MLFTCIVVVGYVVSLVAREGTQLFNLVDELLVLFVLVVLAGTIQLAVM